MAESEFNSPEREEMFRLLVTLNSSLRFIVLKLGELAAIKILSQNYLKEMAALTQEVETIVQRVNRELKGEIIGAGLQPRFRYPVYMPKKKATKKKSSKKTTTRREDVNQAAARIVRQATSD